MGIEPTYAAWEAAVLPMNYTRVCNVIISDRSKFVKLFCKISANPYISPLVMEYVDIAEKRGRCYTG